MTTDFRKTLDCYRARREEFRIVDVPPLQYLMIDGRGDPNTSEEYADALTALYPMAYTLKFMSKQELGKDYAMTPLEGLWWAPDTTIFTTARDKSRWRWTMMIMLPDWIAPAMFEAAVVGVTARGAPRRLPEVRRETLHEGRSVQTLHVGPFDEEAEVLERLHTRFIPDAGLRMTGKHHEIYLSDPRRTAPARLRTILRQPVCAL